MNKSFKSGITWDEIPFNSVLSGKKDPSYKTIPKRRKLIACGETLK